MEKKTLSNALKRFFGVGDFMYNLCISFKTYYWMYFLTTVVALPLAVTSITNTVINTFDLIMAFAWGAIIDSIRPGKWGRYRTMIMIMAPLIVISHAAQWFAPTLFTFTGNVTLASIATILCFGIYIVFFNLAWNANVCLINVCAGSEAERAKLHSTRNAWISASAIFIGYIAAWLIGLFSDPVIGYAAAATLLGVLTIPGYYAHFRMTKGYELERKDYEKIPESQRKQEVQSVSFRDIIRIICSNLQLLWVLLINIGTQLSMFIFAYMSVYLFEMTLKAPGLYAFYLTIINFGAVIGSLLSNVLSSKIPIKRLVQGGLLASIAALMVVWRAALSGNAMLFTGAMVVVQMLVAFVAPLILTFFTNCAVYSEWKTGMNCVGTITGMCGVPIKVALLLVGILVPAILGSAGYVAGQEITDKVANALSNAFALIPAGLYAFSFLILTFCYRLTRERVDQYAKEIAERNK